MKRILIVDDELDLLDLVEYNLQKAGYEVTRSEDGLSALAQVAKSLPELVVLDLMLPDIQGFEVLRRLRDDSRTKTLPVIMLTAMGEEPDILEGFNLGADDYVPKPFSPKELVARVRAVLKRAEGIKPPKGEIEHGALRLNQDSRRVWVGESEIALAPQEYKLLLFLATHPDRVHTREVLLSQVWGEEVSVEPRTVDVHIRRLRSHIETTAYPSEWIETVRGSGYRFNPTPIKAKSQNFAPREA